MTTNRSRLWTCSLVGIAFAVLHSTLLAQNSLCSLHASFDSKCVQNTVESVASIVSREYVDADAGERVDAVLRKWLADGRYRDVTSPEQLSTMLTRDLFTASDDKHLFVTVIPQAGASAKKGENPDREEKGRHTNFGVQRAEIMVGNVGYLNLTSFYRREEGADAVCAGLRLLANADALILDLRENIGGSPDTAVLVISHILNAANVPLFEVSSRSGAIMRFATEQNPVLPRKADRPVYVLTSEHTWSAGEGVAFLLQERHRAEVVGETTAGAANPGQPSEINARFQVNVPNGKVKSAVRGGNWEGTGVVPDVKTPASDALRIAYSRTLRRLLELSPASPWHDEIEEKLRVLGTMPSTSSEQK
jgi:retinol-binding protein 3